jgi:HEPN domain-containing protein
VGYWEKEALRWLKDAIEDLNVARDLLKSKHYSASCFHSQQAAERPSKQLYLKTG